MNLRATHADPLNTSLLSSDNEYRPLYQITTRTPPLRAGITTITKIAQDSSTHHLAQIEWHSTRADILRFELRGVNGDVKDYIGKVKTFSTVRQFTSASGHQYQWDGSVLKSSDSSGAEVARWHREYYGVFHKKHPAYLEVSQEVLQHVDLDEIVVTWAYCQALIQKRWQASTEAVVAGSVSAGIAVGVSS